MEFVGGALSGFIKECTTTAGGLERTGQEGEFQESKELGVNDKHNPQVIRAKRLYPRVPGVRVKGLATPYIIIAGRKGRKGEKVVVLRLGQEWTDQHPPITVHSEADSESDTDRRKFVKNSKREVVNCQIFSDSENECGLEHYLPTERNVGDMVDQKSTQGGGKRQNSYVQATAGTSTTIDCNGNKRFTSQMESNFIYTEGEVALRQPNEKIVDSLEYMVSSPDLKKRSRYDHEASVPKTTEATNKVLTEDMRQTHCQAEDKEPLCNGSGVIIQCDSRSTDSEVRCRNNTEDSPYGTTCPSPSKPRLNMTEPVAHTCELDANASEYKSHNGETSEVDLLSLDPRTRMCRLREMFHERRRFYNNEEDSRIRGAGKGTEGTRSRSDLKAYTYIEKHVMSQSGSNRIIGEVPGTEVGDYFFYRIELLLVGIHRQAQGGIDFIATTGRKARYLHTNGKPMPVAVSVVSSGGGRYNNIYEGETLIYTGQGNNNTDQQLVRGNLALKNSCDLDLSVRVIRGVEVMKGEAHIRFEGLPSVCSPSGFIYIYDGLYKVERYYQDEGSGGFKVWKFKLLRQPDQKKISDFLQGLF